MEIKVIAEQKGNVSLTNFEDLKKDIGTKLDIYKNLIITKENMADGKSTRAKLNTVKKALSDEKIARKKEWLEPFNAFESNIKELISMIDETVTNIDTQVKEIESAEDNEKLEEIKKLFEKYSLDKVYKFENIFNEKWLNKTYPLENIEAEIILLKANYKKTKITLSIEDSSANVQDLIVYLESKKINYTIKTSKRG